MNPDSVSAQVPDIADGLEAMERYKNHKMSEMERNRQVKNGLYFFMSEFQNLLDKKRIYFCGGIEEIFEKAAQIWEEMTSLERWKYEEMARIENERIKNMPPENETNSPSKTYMQMVREKTEAVDYNRNMLLEIENTVNSLHGLALAAYPFYLIHVNCYCSQINGVAIPCELAIAEFNLMDGVRKTYHTIIDPGPIPLGYAFEAEVHSADSHQLPLPPNSLGGEKDFQRIFKDIRGFLSRVKQVMPPLFTHPTENINIVRNVLCSLQKSCDIGFCVENDIFRVYPLLNLFYELRNACARFKDEKGFPVMGFAEKELERDDFSFTKGISCKFHEQTEAIQNCSLSKVHRWSYILINPCCKDLEIDCISGQHLPKQLDLSYWRRVLDEAGLLKKAQLSLSTAPIRHQDTNLPVQCASVKHCSPPGSVVSFCTSTKKKKIKRKFSQHGSVMHANAHSHNLTKNSGVWNSGMKPNSFHLSDQTNIFPFSNGTENIVGSSSIMNSTSELDQRPVKLEKPKANTSSKISILNPTALKKVHVNPSSAVKEFGNNFDRPAGISVHGPKIMMKECGMKHIKTNVRGKEPPVETKKTQKVKPETLMKEFGMKHVQTDIRDKEPTIEAKNTQRTQNFKPCMKVSEVKAEQKERKLTTSTEKKCAPSQEQDTSSKEQGKLLKKASPTKKLVVYTVLQEQDTLSKEQDKLLKKASSTKKLVVKKIVKCKQNQNLKKISGKSSLTPVRLPKSNPEALSYIDLCEYDIID